MASFDCYIAVPQGQRKVPAIVLASAIHGVDEDLKGIAGEFVAKGYIAAAPDLFWRSVPGPLPHDDPRSRPRGQPRLEKIIAVHFPNLKKSLLREALDVFFEVREVPGLKKKPSTSELLDWLKLLLAEDIPPEALRSKDRKTIIPPLHGALLKNEQDVHLFERLVFMTRAKGG